MGDRPICIEILLCNTKQFPWEFRAKMLGYISLLCEQGFRANEATILELLLYFMKDFSKFSEKKYVVQQNYPGIYAVSCVSCSEMLF